MWLPLTPWDPGRPECHAKYCVLKASSFSASRPPHTMKSAACPLKGSRPLCGGSPLKDTPFTMLSSRGSQALLLSPASLWVCSIQNRSIHECCVPESGLGRPGGVLRQPARSHASMAPASCSRPPLPQLMASGDIHGGAIYLPKSPLSLSTINTKRNYKNVVMG